MQKSSSFILLLSPLTPLPSSPSPPPSKSPSSPSPYPPPPPTHSPSLTDFGCRCGLLEELVLLGQHCCCSSSSSELFPDSKGHESASGVEGTRCLTIWRRRSSTIAPPAVCVWRGSVCTCTIVWFSLFKVIDTTLCGMSKASKAEWEYKHELRDCRPAVVQNHVSSSASTASHFTNQHCLQCFFTNSKLTATSAPVECFFFHRWKDCIAIQSLPAS